MPKQIVKRYDKLLAGRAIWETEWEDIATYVLPRKKGVTGHQTPGVRRTQRIFDSTALKANSDLASAMHGTLTPDGLRWFTLKFRNADLNADIQVQQWLEKASQVMWEGLTQSNFSSEVNELYLDLGAFGTGAMLILEMPIERTGFNGFLFRSIPIGTYVVSEDQTGQVDTFMYKTMMSARVIAERWPTRQPDAIKQAMEQEKWEEQFPVLHAIYPRHLDEEAAKRVGDAKPRARAAADKPWASDYIFMKAVESSTYLERGGFNTRPFITPRWTKFSGELYGRGPGHDAMPDILTLNKAVQLILKQWNKVIDPPFGILDRAVVAPMQLWAGGTTIVKNKDAIFAIESKARFDVNGINKEQLVSSIRKIYFSDQINFPGQLRPGAKTPPSAAEVQAGLETMHRILGPTLGRYNREGNAPLLDRTFDMMLQAGELPPMPAILQEAVAAGDVDLDIEFEGPLAMTEKRSELRAVDETFARLAPLMQVDEAVLDPIKTEEVGFFIASRTNLDPSLVRTKEDVAERSIARKEAKAKAEEGLQFNQFMTAIGKAGGVAKLLEVMQQAGGSPTEGQPTTEEA